MDTSPDNKELGAYYTPTEVVQELVCWATNGRTDAPTLDPSCGDGRFLRGLESGVGVDLDPAAITRARSVVPTAELYRRDFFAWARSSAPDFDAVVGNPPFIRYQRFSGEARRRAQAFCEARGVRLSGLSSSWAHFVVGASTLLRPGGRLGFVVPAEIGYAVYARNVVRYLVDSFGELRIRAVRKKLFPHLSEDCWLLEAADFGGRARKVTLSLADEFGGAGTTWTDIAIPRDLLEEYEWRLRPFLLPPPILDAYDRTRRSGGVRRLGEIVRLGIGYVTGANDFFHLRPSEAAQWRIPDKFLTPAVRSSRDLQGDDVSQRTVRSWLTEDRPSLLLDLNEVSRIPAAVRRYLDSEEGRFARQSYKCQTRDPWYCVPDVRVPDAFLSIMAGAEPRLVSNSSGAVCTNSVHAVHLADGYTISDIQRSWATPLARLSCEVEGHSLGGGLLKLEPREARQILLPLEFDVDIGTSQLLEAGIHSMREWRGVSDS